MVNKYYNDVIESLNKDIDNITNYNRIFVINNEETYVSQMFMRTNGLKLNDISNFCIEHKLIYDPNNERILLMETQIKDMKTNLF